MLSRFALVFLVCLTVFGCEGDYTIYDAHPPEVVYIDVPIEVLVEVPGEGGDVWVDSFEQPYSVDGVDIVWLIDRSGSMNTFDQAVIDGIGQMMSALPAAGWRLGITTTDYIDSTSVSNFPLVPGDTVADAELMYNSLSNFAHREAGFDALHSYLINNAYNQTWLRDGAALLVVFVSDEDEQSNAQFTSAPAGLQEFIQWYGNRRQSVFMASIVKVPILESVCDNSYSPIDIGDRYIDATNAFNGVVVDICEEDWSPGVAAASSQVEPHGEWPLTHTPIEETLIVFEDTVPMADADWVYNAATNSVEFLVVPYEGALVEIGYVIDHDGGDDDDSAGDDDDSSGS
jgi:hypothetical protein